MPNDLGPERLTLRQADQAREDLAQILDEYDFKHINSVLRVKRRSPVGVEAA